MDAQIASGSGFDAALKALEDLETDVAQARETAPAPISVAPVSVAPVSVTPAPIASVGSSLGAIEPIALDFADDAPADPAPAPEASAPVAHAPKPVEIAVTAVDPQPASAKAVSDEPAPDAVISPTASAPAPETFPTPPAPVKRSKLPAVAVGLGLFSSIVSAVGLVVVSRTVVEASLVVADARERAEQMKRVGGLVHELEAIRAQQLALLQRQQAIVATPPITGQDLDRRFGELREGLLARDQSKAMLDLVHDGQSQLNDTMGAIGVKVSRIESKIDAKH